MRTVFDPDEQREYAVASDLLIRRCAAWAQDRGLHADATTLRIALDSRHHARDGRLAFWAPRQIRHLFLEWMPAKAILLPEEIQNAPATLRTWLAFLADTGILDPRGGTPAENEVAIAGAQAGFLAAMADQRRWGVEKYLAFHALQDDLDLSDTVAFEEYTQRFIDNHGESDPLLRELLEREDDSEEPPRDVQRFPVTLPARAELTRLAGEVPLVERVRAFVDWVGPEGKALAADGSLTAADTDAVAAVLGAAGARDPRAAAGLERDLARAAGLVRATGNRLVRVAEAPSMLADPYRLFELMFAAVLTLSMRDASCRREPDDLDLSGLHLRYADVAPAIVDVLYAQADSPMPPARLEEMLWQLDNLDRYVGPVREKSVRTVNRRDLERFLDLLVALGAAQRSHGVPAPHYAETLDELTRPRLGEPPVMSHDTARRLRAEFARPGPLVALSALGVAAVRARLLAQGREAALVGELAGVAPAGLLSVIAEHYDVDAATVEIRGWLAGHGDDPAPLFDALRSCPFHARAAAALDVVSIALGDPVAVLGSLRDDPVLGPMALSALAERGALDLSTLAESQQAQVMTESLLCLLELHGPEEVRASLAAERLSITTVLRDMRASGHADRAAISEFEQLLGTRPARPAPPRPSGPRGSRRPARKKDARGRRR